MVISWELQGCCMKHLWSNLLTQSQRSHLYGWTFHLRLWASCKHFERKKNKKMYTKDDIRCLGSRRYVHLIKSHALFLTAWKNTIQCVEFEQHLLIKLETWHLIYQGWYLISIVVTCIHNHIGGTHIKFETNIIYNRYLLWITLF